MLDPDLADFAWRLPMAMKLRDGVGKWALREVLAKYVPCERFERPGRGLRDPGGNVAAWAAPGVGRGASLGGPTAARGLSRSRPHSGDVGGASIGQDRRGVPPLGDPHVPGVVGGVGVARLGSERRRGVWAAPRTSACSTCARPPRRCRVRGWAGPGLLAATLAAGSGRGACGEAVSSGPPRVGFSPDGGLDRGLARRRASRVIPGIPEQPPRERVAEVRGHFEARF